MLQKLYVFFRKETVLSIAVILALLSMFWVRPDKAYFTYIDQAPLLFDGNCSWFEDCWCDQAVGTLIFLPVNGDHQ